MITQYRINRFARPALLFFASFVFGTSIYSDEIPEALHGVWEDKAAPNLFTSIAIEGIMQFSCNAEPPIFQYEKVQRISKNSFCAIFNENGEQQKQCWKRNGKKIIVKHGRSQKTLHLVGLLERDVRQNRCISDGQ